jgi:hypothetical protein
VLPHTQHASFLCLGHHNSSALYFLKTHERPRRYVTKLSRCYGFYKSKDGLLRAVNVGLLLEFQMQKEGDVERLERCNNFATVEG